MEIKFFELIINIKDEKEYLRSIEQAIKNIRDKTLFFYLNSYSFYLSQTNKEFSIAFKKANYLIADGYSIVWAVKFLSKTIINKVVFTYSFFPQISNILHRTNAKVFVLGGTEKEVKTAIHNIQGKAPALSIVGYHNGYFAISTDSDLIIRKINASHATVLIVAMGMPRSETWVCDNLSNLNVKVIFCVGGFLSFISGDKKVAPKWMYNSGLEWFHRLIQDPERLWKRYLLANPFLLCKVITMRVRNVLFRFSVKGK